MVELCTGIKISSQKWYMSLSVTFHCQSKSYGSLLISREQGRTIISCSWRLGEPAIFENSINVYNHFQDHYKYSPVFSKTCPKLLAFITSYNMYLDIFAYVQRIISLILTKSIHSVGHYKSCIVYCKNSIDGKFYILKSTLTCYGHYNEKVIFVGPHRGKGWLMQW